MKCSCDKFTKGINYTNFDGASYKIRCHNEVGRFMSFLINVLYLRKILSNVFI